MALNPADALETARAIHEGQRASEMLRLDRIATALMPGQQGSVILPSTSPPQMRELARKSSTNYLPLILDSLVQTMFVDGYRPARSAENAAPWDVWQANRMDARQTGVHRSTLKYGAAYVVVTPGDPVPTLRGVSPRSLTAVYGDPDEDDWPILALRCYGDGSFRLIDEEAVYFLGRESPLSAGVGPPDRFIEARRHDLGVCPVVRFRDRMLLESEEQLGVIEPVLTIQERVDETTFGLLVAQYYAAFKQRYIIGWVPDSEEAQLRASASRIWTFDKNPSDMTIGEFTESDLSKYLESKDSAVKDMAAISQVPPQQLAVGAMSNLSAEALAAMEAGKDRKVAEIETSLGESWEQTFQLAATASGGDPVADDAQVRWRDATARSLAQTVDALGKMVQMLGIPPQAVWERVPGATQQDIENWKALAAETDAFAGLTSLLDSQSAPTGPFGG